MSEVVDWTRLLKGAFAFQTATFGSHPLDERRADQMFHAAMNAGASIDDICLEAERYLKSQKCEADWISNQLKMIRSYRHNPVKKLKSKKAWLITWETIAGEGAGYVVALMNSRKSGEAVAEFLENFYIATQYSVAEKLTYAKSKKNNPYPAAPDRLEGGVWWGRITCGADPFLYARLVANVAVQAKDGGEVLVWEELKRPKIYV